MKFTDVEIDFLKSNELCRLATVDEYNSPHVVPVCFLFIDGVFYIVTDIGTKKHKNLQKRPRASLVVDVYKPNKAVMVVGRAELLYSGEEFCTVSKAFFERFDWARRDPWSEGQAVIIKLIPEKKLSWGLRRGRT